MKLKNKKTGKTIEAVIVDHGAEWEIRNMYTDEDTQTYNSLAGLYEEWKDYEEQKKYYVINPVDWVEVIGEIEYRNDSTDKINKEIGNYFETKEEAEKAVEKLKAWKRLKENGFRFIGLGNDRYGVKDIKYRIDPPTGFEENEDLHLLFGGEQ